MVASPLTANPRASLWLVSPFDSCIGDDPGSEALLSRTISLLTFAHKYCATQIETRAQVAAIELVRDTSFGPETYPQIPRLLNAAQLLACPELGVASKEVFLKLIRKSTQHSHSALSFGEYLGDRDIQTEAYLSLLRHYGGDMGWEFDPSLTPLHKKRLSFGMRRCAQEWLDIHARIMSSQMGCGGQKCIRKLRIVEDAVKLQRRVPFFDVIGMLDTYKVSSNGVSMRCIHNDYRCIDRATDVIDKECREAPANLRAIFFDNTLDVSEYPAVDERQLIEHTVWRSPQQDESQPSPESSLPELPPTSE